ncbi:hypothetical protein LJR066_003761 [Acidovorax sp. LjRoot66]|uniref:hypothetical protein n=1 Tax=Acidovorax sp. LjRoot66 TaxID=3342334 RepID=UPI003ECFE35D
MNVIIKIGGRDAIPVRAIPLLTYRETMSADYLAKALAGDEHFYHFEGLKAFGFEGGQARELPEAYWSNVVNTRLEALSAEIRSKEVSHEAGLNKWRSESIKALPAGVFVWRDEFEPRHERRFIHARIQKRSATPWISMNKGGVLRVVDQQLAVHGQR